MIAKSDVVAKIKDLSSSNSCLVVVDYKGADASTISLFRGDLLKKCGVKLLVAKNTLFAVAVKGNDGEKLGKLKGQSGFIFCNDIISVSKVVNDYCFDKKALKFVSGINEGELCGEGEIKEFASLPTLEGARQRIMVAINSVGSSLLYLLSEKFKEKGNE